MKMAEIKVWIGNLGKYNEGELVGEWFTAPLDWQEVKEAIGLNAEYEEHFIADYEAPINIHEYTSFDKINEIAELIQDLDDEQMEVVSYLVDNYYAQDFEEAIEMMENDVMYYYDCHNMEDVAMRYVEETGFPYNAEHYIDTEALIRDLHIGGDIGELEYQRTQEMIEEGELEEGEEYEMTEEEIEDYANEIVEIFVSELESPYGDKTRVNNFIESYFDYKSFGRDLEINDDFVEMSSFYIYIIG